MPKGLFTQSAVVLCETPPALDDLQSALNGFQIARRFEPSAERTWMGGNPGFLLAMRPEVNGYALLDIIDQPWPDGMGDPKRDVMLFGAWSMGFFGPFTFPSGLRRAREHAWHLRKEQELAARHQSFVRLKSSYALGPGMKDKPVMPADYQPLPELQFMTRVAQAVLSLRGALLYFNPNGEMLHTAASIRSALDFAASHDLVPVDLWTNVRMYRRTEAPGWTVMDTVGMAQLDVPDHEACVPEGFCSLSDVAGFLRNTAHYAFAEKAVFQNNDTIDGPGGLWRVQSFEEPLNHPPRAVLRWRPDRVATPALFGLTAALH
jgi:hypothetical protein